MRITEERARELSPQGALATLINLVEILDRGEIPIRDFTASMKALINKHFCFYPYCIEELDRIVDRQDETIQKALI